jgi:hypothetical protein
MSQSPRFSDRNMRGKTAGPKGVCSTSAMRRGLLPVKTKVVSLGMLLLKRQNSPTSSILRAFCLGVNDIAQTCSDKLVVRRRPTSSAQIPDARTTRIQKWRRTLENLATNPRKHTLPHRVAS